MTASPLHKKDKLNIINWLIEYFPAAFFKKGHEVKPLQIGIFEEILAFYDRLESQPFSKKILREALHFYSQSPAYLKAQKEGAVRVDLYGNEVDIVNAEQANYAEKKYLERYVTKKVPAKPVAPPHAT
jgi:ProP effector